MKIIIADDSRVMRIMIDRAVAPLGLATVHACNGQEVLDLLAADAKAIALVLLDWNMPVMNGIEVLEAMGRDDRYKDIPALIVSTEAEDAKMQQALAAGARGYLPKPFAAEELAELIRKTIPVG